MEEQRAWESTLVEWAAERAYSGSPEQQQLYHPFEAELAASRLSTTVEMANVVPIALRASTSLIEVLQR